MKRSYLLGFIASTLIANANVVEIKEGLPFVEVEDHGKTVKIERVQKEDSYLTNTFALTSRPSPPFFIEPFEVSEGIETYGELEVLEFLQEGKGVFVDARLKNWYKKSAIPGSVNIPFKVFLNDTDERVKILRSFGVQYNRYGRFDFIDAKEILLYCNGAWCGQSPTAINALVEIGYPKSKLKYYRGGMQSWQLLGLTTIIPGGK